MGKRPALAMTAMVIVIGMLGVALNIQQVKASGTIYIRADGSVDPPTAPIQRVGDVYTFTDNIYEEIVVERSNIIVDGNGYTLQGSKVGCGFNLTSVSNVTIQNANINGFKFGVHLFSSSNTVVSGNNITNNDRDGVRLYVASNHNAISWNSIANNGGSGVNLYESSEHNVISGNNITNNGWIGVMLWRTANYNTVSGNNITDNEDDGVCIFEYSNRNNTISGNFISGSKYSGVWLCKSSHNMVSGNTVTNNDYHGVWLTGSIWFKSHHNTIYGNNITNNGEGVGLHMSSHNTISGNNITNNHMGIYPYDSSSNTISGNFISGSKYSGIYFAESSSNNITGNIMANNNIECIHACIYLHFSSDHNIFSGNTITNSNQAVWLRESSNVTFSGNVINGNTRNFKVWGDELSHFVHSIDVSNLVNGKPVYYLVNQKSLVITSVTHPQVGYLALVNCTDITVEDLTLTDNEHGLLLAYTNNSRLTGNTVTNNEYGIVLYASVNNELRSNSMADNEYNFAVWGSRLSEYVHDVDTSNTVDGKPVYYWTDRQDVMVPLDAGYVGLVNCTRTTIQNLKLTNNGEGILFAFTSDSTITGNNITKNDVGIRLYNSSDNSIYHNNFVDNTDAAITENSVNVWDDGYPSGGNYWSDYEDTDIYKGLYQNEAGSDGIGDTPNILDESNIDKYPLIAPTYWSIIYFNLTITSTEGGTTNPVSGTYTYVNGTTVFVTAIPDADYVFDHWELDGMNIGSGNPVDVLMDENHTLLAVFVLRVYELTITSTIGGTTDPLPGEHNYQAGSSVDATAIPNVAYSFNYWLLDGEERTKNPTTVIMDTNHTLEAVFVDDIAPEIGVPMQDPPENVEAYENVTIMVDVSDLGTGVHNVTLWYSINNGTTWMHRNMTETTADSYQATIPGYENCTWITYKIVAYDNNGNQATNDNHGIHYIYHVIPEFPILIVMLTFTLATLLAVIVTNSLNRTQPKST